MLLPSLMLPPQAHTPVAIDASASIGMEIANSLRRFRLRQPAIGMSRSENTPPAMTTAALTLLLIVSVVVDAAVPFGITVVGLKVQVELAGRPEHANVVSALNPLTGVTETVMVAGLPPVMDPLPGLSESVKSAAGGALMVTAKAADVEELLSASPA